MKDDGSYRQILRSSSIIGGASVINIVIGLLRIKMAAALLGPAGIGLIGLLTTLASTASTVAGLGFGNVGTRQIAEAAGKQDAAAMAAARRALFWGSLVLAFCGAAVFWLLRNVFAVHVLGDVSLSNDLGWLALAVALTVASASQTALLNGMRQIGDLARVSVLSALLSTLLGVSALMLWGRGGLITFVIAAPLASFLLGHVYVARLPKIDAPRTPMLILVEQWTVLAKLGAAFMVAGLAVILGQLAVRILVQQQLGLDALGFYQAASAISMTYIGFVLTAMGTDYYPRLTAVIHDQAAVNRMVNEQTEVALLLVGPIILAMIGLAPWVIELLYASSFHPATDILRLQVLGDLLKICSWPLGFVILAAGHGRNFMVTEGLATMTFVMVAWLLLPKLGLVGSALAYVCMYVVYLPMVFMVSTRIIDFRWGNRVLVHAVVLLVAASILMFVASWSSKIAAVLSICGVITFTLYGLGRLAEAVNMPGVVGDVAELSRKIISKLGVVCVRR